MKIFLKFSLFLLFILLSSSSLKSQVNQEWAARFNGLLDSIDVAVDLVADPQGNVYVTGYTFNLLSGIDYLTIKYSSTGQELWTRTYNGAGNLTDRAAAIAADSKGNIYVTGSSFGGILSGFNYTTIKYSPAGDQLWTMSYNSSGNGDDEAGAVAVDNSDNVVVTGYSESSSIPGSEDYLTVKYSPEGQELWSARYNGPGSSTDKSYAVIIDDSDNIIITGGSRATSLPDSEDYATVKYSPSGEEQWVARYNGAGNSADIAYAVIIDDSDNIIVTGESRSTSLPGSENYTTVKYSSSGEELWAEDYDGPGNSSDKSYAVVIDDSDNIIVTGESRSSSLPGSEDYATVKYSPSGEELWVARYNGPGNSLDRPYSIAVDTKNNIIITGESRSGSLPGSEDYATVKYSPSGQEQWAVRYNGPANSSDKSYAVIIDDSDNILITGSSRSAALPGKEDYLTIKYSEAINVGIISTVVPERYSFSQNYPNPFNPATKISFSIPVSSNVNIAVYDIAGNLISVLLDENLGAGSYEIQWEAGSHLSSGVYFYTIRVNDPASQAGALNAGQTFYETRKMLLVK